MSKWSFYGNMVSTHRFRGWIIHDDLVRFSSLILYLAKSSYGWLALQLHKNFEKKNPCVIHIWLNLHRNNCHIFYILWWFLICLQPKKSQKNIVPIPPASSYPLLKVIIAIMNGQIYLGIVVLGSIFMNPQLKLDCSSHNIF